MSWIASGIAALIEFVKSLDLSVLAEGVERASQRDILAELGCDDYQGYHYGPALTARDFADMPAMRSGAPIEKSD